MIAIMLLLILSAESRFLIERDIDLIGQFSCPVDDLVCDQPLSYEETKHFSCNDLCPDGYACCEDSCFVHKICKPSGISGGVEKRKEENCPEETLTCAIPFPPGQYDQLACKEGSCPEGYKCCSDSCFYFKVCKKVESSRNEKGEEANEANQITSNDITVTFLGTTLVPSTVKISNDKVLGSETIYKCSGNYQCPPCHKCCYDQKYGKICKKISEDKSAIVDVVTRPITIPTTSEFVPMSTETTTVTEEIVSTTTVIIEPNETETSTVITSSVTTAFEEVTNSEPVTGSTTIDEKEGKEGKDREGEEDTSKKEEEDEGEDKESALNPTTEPLKIETVTVITSFVEEVTNSEPETASITAKEENGKEGKDTENEEDTSKEVEEDEGEGEPTTGNQLTTAPAVEETTVVDSGDKESEDNDDYEEGKDDEEDYDDNDEDKEEDYDEDEEDKEEDDGEDEEDTLDEEDDEDGEDMLNEEEEDHEEEEASTSANFFNLFN